MAKSKKKVKRDGNQRVFCFCFYGSVDGLGAELSKALKDAGLAEALNGALKTVEKSL